MTKLLTAIIVFLFISKVIFSQKEVKPPRYFDNPVLIDSTGIILIPTRYNSEYLSNNKLALWDNYYANILITKPDNSDTRKLFDEDTYIEPIAIERNDYYRSRNYSFSSSIKKNWIFFLVKNIDSNGNDRIDHDDPTMLYLTDLNGNGLRRLTPGNESVSSYFVFESQSCVMIRMQKDINKDSKFNSRDKSYYFLLLDLNTFTEIKRIEL